MTSWYHEHVKSQNPVTPVSNAIRNKSIVNLDHAPVIKCIVQPSYKKYTHTQVSQYANWVTVTVINYLW
jgi:hypothetical protein